MKKGVLWATLLALLLVLLTGCGDDPAPPVENYDMEAAMEYIKTVYKNAQQTTDRNYQRIAMVPVGESQFEIIWTVDVAEDVVRISAAEDGMVTVIVNQNLPRDTVYTLTATVTDGEKVLSHQWNHLIPGSARDAMGKLVEQAYTLENGQSLPEKVTLTGVITQINIPLSESPDGITATIVVADKTGKPVRCNLLMGENAKDLAVNDTITVTGTLRKQGNLVEFVAGNTLDAVQKGAGAPQAPSDSKLVVDEAFALPNGNALPYASVTLTGQVLKIHEPYDATTGFVTLTMEVESSRGARMVRAYHLVGEGLDTLQVGMLVTVEGHLLRDNGFVRFAADCRLLEAKAAPLTLPEGLTPVYAPNFGVAYKFFLLPMGELGTLQYFSGEMDGFVYTTTDNLLRAENLYLEEVTGGLRAYFKMGGMKNYIEIVKNGKSVVAVITTTPTKVLQYNTDINSLTCTVEGVEYCFGIPSGKAVPGEIPVTEVTGQNIGALDVTAFVFHLCKEAEVIPEPEVPGPETPETPENPENPENPGTGEDVPGGEQTPGDEQTPGGEQTPGDEQTPGGEQTPGDEQTPGGEQTSGDEQTPGGEQTSGDEQTSNAGDAAQ